MQCAANGRNTEFSLGIQGRKDKCYFAKITLDNGNFAITSPVWIE